MSSCEKCWVDHQETGLSYTQFLKDREAAGQVCTPEQQAGPDAGECPRCRRKTLHQYTAEPMCGCRSIFQAPNAEAIEAVRASLDRAAE